MNWFQQARDWISKQEENRLTTNKIDHPNTKVGVCTIYRHKKPYSTQDPYPNGSARRRASLIWTWGMTTYVISLSCSTSFYNKQSLDVPKTNLHNFQMKFIHSHSKITLCQFEFVLCQVKFIRCQVKFISQIGIMSNQIHTVI